MGSSILTMHIAMNKNIIFVLACFNFLVLSCPLPQPQRQIEKDNDVLPLEGCINTCCSVCIPGKNCDVCYKLNKYDPEKCPCINNLSKFQKESILAFQKYFKDKLTNEEKSSNPWDRFITTKNGEKIFY